MARVNEWDYGDTQPVNAALKDIYGNPVDPETIQLRIRRPDKVMLVFIYGSDNLIIRDGVGRYHADIYLNQSGDWYYRWEIQMPGERRAAEEKRLRVRASRFYG